MRKKALKIMKFAVIVGVSGALFVPNAVRQMTVSATSISDMQKKISETENQIKDINSKIDTLSDEQDLIQEKIDDITAEIVNTMTSIGMKEDELAEKEQELVIKQSDIDQTQKAYDIVKERESKQYKDMMKRLRRMYENGDTTYAYVLAEGQGLGDVLNRMDFIQKLCEYDQEKLQEFEETRTEVLEMWNQVEDEKLGLEEDKKRIEEAKASLEAQKKDLDVMLAQRKKESANYEAEISKARQEASVAKKLLQQEKKELKKLQDAQKKGNKSNAANITYTNTSYTATVDGAGGSDLGKKIAKYGLQYVGNPYVSGGTSLTSGADCSGFTYRIYSDFGYSIPRTSREQRSAGVGVDYSNAQPGDLICYDGHVGLYIGGGKIVHASNAKTGIKVSTATYRSILAVRRIIS